jgi:hypothetical protein
MRLLLPAARASEPTRDQQERRLHVEAVLNSKLARLWRQAPTAYAAPDPKALSHAGDVGQVDLSPGVVFGDTVPGHNASTPLIPPLPCQVSRLH